MNRLQDCKFINVTPPAAIVDNALFVTASVDTRGWNEAAFIASFGAMDVAAVLFKLRESDDDSAYTDVSGADFSVSPLTLPSATSDNTIFGIFVRCGGGRKRYLDLTVQGGDGAAGTYLSVTAILSKGVNGPDSATERGLAQQAIV